MRAAIGALFTVILAACGTSSGTLAPSAGAPLTTPIAATVAPTSPATAPPASDGTGEPVRIALPDAAPDAVLLDGPAAAYVLTGEGGTLLEVDLGERRVSDSFEVGFGATHFARPEPGFFAVGRFDNSGSGAYCVLVDLLARRVVPVQTAELAALTAGETGIVWAVEKAGRLVKIARADGKVVDSAPVQIGQNVHIEVQWGAGSAWVGSDGLPVIRVSGDDPADQQTIPVPTGIPFLFKDGLVWGAGPTELWAIDPATNAITRHVPLAGVIEILGLDVQGNEAWLAVRKTGRVGMVVRLDLASGAVVAEYPVSLPAAVRIGPDRAWVASYETNELLGFAR